MAMKTRKRPGASSSPPPQTAKKRRGYNKVDKVELARTVLYLSPRYLAKKTGQPQLSSRALYEEARMLLGLENSWKSLCNMFTQWRKAEGSAWDKMQENEEDYFADLVEREKGLKRQQRSVVGYMEGADGTGLKLGCGVGEAGVEVEAGAGNLSTREEESDDAQSNETLYYDLDDAAMDMDGQDQDKGPKAHHQFHFHIESVNVFHNHFYAGVGGKGGA